MTVAGRELLELLERGDDDLPPAPERWKRLLTDRNAAVRLKAEIFVFCALHGTPRPASELPAAQERMVITLKREDFPGEGDEAGGLAIPTSEVGRAERTGPFARGKTRGNQAQERSQTVTNGEPAKPL